MKEDNKAGREELYSETKYLVYIIPAMLCSAYSTIAASTVTDHPIWFYASWKGAYGTYCGDLHFDDE